MTCSPTGSTGQPPPGLAVVSATAFTSAALVPPIVLVEDLTLASPVKSSAVSPSPMAPALQLLDLLSNTLILTQTLPYLEPAEVLALASISKSFRELVHSFPSTFHYLNLSPIKHLVLENTGPLDRGGNTWRESRMDDSLTPDEFYSGPLQRVFVQLEKNNWLTRVSTLVLDGITVTNDILREVVLEQRYNVQILSLRQSHNLNEYKLCQLLKYAVRPTRAAGTPKLKGVYVFGPMDPQPAKEEPLLRQRSPTRMPNTRPAETIQAVGRNMGHEWNRRSQATLAAELSQDEDKWYQSAGKVIARAPKAIWTETLQACEGIIHFDAILCRGPRHEPPTIPDADTSSYLPPAIATIALGPTGCAKCGTCPEGPGMCGSSPSHHLPLVAPPPLHWASLRVAQMPGPLTNPKLIVRCADCMRSRWCERCHKWWCETCYDPGTFTSMQETEHVQSALAGRTGSEDIKMGARRDCFGCGQTCVDCKDLYIRACMTCSNEYCLVDNDGSSPVACDWCNYSGRRTRELY